MNLTIGTVMVSQPAGRARNPASLRRSLEANLARDLANLQVSSAREAKVVQARVPSGRAMSNLGAAISQAITQALGKAR